MTGDSTALFHGLKIERDVEIPLRGGSHLAADVFRPDGSGQFPTIITLGPYSKDIHFKDWNRTYDYAKLPERGPYMHWETVNPEWWVPQGYAVIRVDGRGTGKSPGRIRRLSDEEAADFYDAVEWAGTQPFSNGRVAVMGISYFAMNSWRVAAAQPPHLAAIVPWEGAVDTYRDASRHGGIYSNGFNRRWASHVREHEAGAAKAAPPPTPAGVTPPELFDPAAYHVPDLAKIQVPLLSAGNWGGFGLHLRGNVEGFLGAGSRQKFLQIHCGDHVVPFYSLEGRLTQKRFLDTWLCGIDTGLTREPPIKLAIRTTSERWRWRYENEWPLARTEWTAYPLDASRGGLALAAPAAEATASYTARLGAPRELACAKFATEPFARETEFTGPVKLKLWVSSSGDDADLFAIVRKLDAQGREVQFQGSINFGFPVAYGWQRVSHRKLDPVRSTPSRPFHTHDDIQKVVPGEVVAVEIEIWPTSIVFEKGETLVLEVAAHDEPRIAPFLHDDPRDRVLAERITLHTGGRFDTHLLLPRIPAR